MPDDSAAVVTAPHVRVATKDEVDEVMKLALMGCAENEFMPHDPVKVLQDVYAALIKENGICGVIGPVGGELEGAVLLRIGTIWYSEHPHVEERAIFVHPAYRSARGGRAKLLAEFSMQVADRLQLPLTIGVLSDNRTEAKVRLYQRVLGKPAGAYWIYWPMGHPKHREPEAQPVLAPELRSAIKALYAEAKKIGRDAGLEHPEEYIRQLFSGAL